MITISPYHAYSIALVRMFLFTCNVCAMYTNIDTEHASSELRHMLPPFLIPFLKIINCRNIFQFSNTYW